MSWHFVAALCILSCLHQSVTTGLIPASLSTLERRYELSSVESGLILSTYDIVKLLMVIPVSYLAGKRHIPKAIAFCCVIMSLGCATFAFVHYLSPPYVPQSTTEGESICSDFPIFPPCLNRNSSWLFPLMLIGQAIIAIGAAAVYCIGPAYILSSMDTRYALIAMGFFYASSVVGSALGFVEGGIFLDSWVDTSGLPEGFEDLSPSSPVWVGKWWLGILLACFGILALTPVFLFMSHRPRPTFESTVTLSDSTPPVTSMRDAWMTIKMILTNQAWWFLTLAVASEALVVSGFAGFGAKYLEVEFGLRSTSASLLAGAGIVPAATLGMLAGAWWDGRSHTKLSQTTLFNTKMAFVATIFLFGSLFLSCEPAIHGLEFHEPYLNLRETCNVGCNCAPSFEPVCGENGVTYFSPCYAGCSNVSSGGIYGDCRCINSVGTATAGHCSQCRLTLGFFVTLLCLFLFFTMLNHSPSTAALMRLFPASHQSVSLALNDFMLKSLGAIPGPILFGVAFDGSCIVSTSTCPSDPGSCVLYDSPKVRFVLILVFGVGFKILSVIFNAQSYLTLQKHEHMREVWQQLDDDFIDENQHWS